jgi:GNAT superfamily N-acetyltransferase
MTDPVAMFVRQMKHRAPGLATRLETDADRAFLQSLFIACSPMRTLLPASLLEQQAAMQIESHNSAHPAAMRCIIANTDGDIGRIMVDWGSAHSHGVDIAVFPDARASNAGMAMLRSWIDTADSLCLSCSLDVLTTNPARHIYRRLGFQGIDDASAASIRMERPARQSA